MHRFRDRQQAGRQLAEALSAYARRRGVVVLAIPRGGLEVGFEVATRLHAPLDVVVSKKIGHPGNPEVAIGAVSHGRAVELSEEYISGQGISREYVNDAVKLLEKEVDEKRRRYTGGKPLPQLKNKTVIIVDDGIATGSTVLAAIKFVRSQKAKKVVVATPVAPPEVCEKLRAFADEVLCLLQPPFFSAVGEFYERFGQVTDGQAIEYLRKANAGK